MRRSSLRPGGVVVEAERGGRRPHLAPVVENLDAPLCRLEPRMTEARELDAALEELERLLEREVSLLERLDDRLELGQRGFEIFDRGINGVSGLLSAYPRSVDESTRST
jgi:hypothetical protein